MTIAQLTWYEVNCLAYLSVNVALVCVNKAFMCVTCRAATFKSSLNDAILHTVQCSGKKPEANRLALLHSASKH